MLMKFGFLLFDYFPFGGLERDCLCIAVNCVARGHNVTIFTRSWEGERPANITVELFGRHGLTNTSRNRHWLKQLTATLSQRELDCVVGFNKLPGLDVYFGSDLCFAAKIKATKPFWYRWLPRCRHLAGLERAVFNRGMKSEILLLTPDDIPNYKKIYGTEDRFHILPANATRRDFTGAQQAQTRRRIREVNGWPSGDNLLVFVGSDFQRKGLDRAIRGLAALDPAAREQTQFAVLGKCDPDGFARLARNLGVAKRVHFLGGRTDAPDWMLAADALVHPARSETAGAVLVEALASHLPIIVSGVCGYAFHVERAKAGAVLCEPFQQEEFNRALRTALEPSTSRQWRANAAAYAAGNELYGCHERAAEIIEAVALRKQGRRSGGV
ncbi:MAG TPA: glycosyltransferase family 4 protein [Verrucomicrobiae bacterium]|jgi:UDP-glucose:(heptosyl)LPS alpha-1,3-glucosyltransferase